MIFHVSGPGCTLCINHPIAGKIAINTGDQWPERRYLHYDKLPNIVAEIKKNKIMDQELSLLSQEEVTLLKDAHAYITVLIAGADGNIDDQELSWAEKIVQIRTFAGDERLKEFHEAVNQELAGKIKELVATLPTDPAVRNTIISDKLAQLNPILASLQPAIGAYLYKGYVSFAERIAKASGGVLSFFSIGPEERKWVALPMLTAIAYNPDEEE